MGRFLWYLIPALEKKHPDVTRNRALDTYGPGSAKIMPFWFALTFFRLIWEILLRRVDFVHIHMASYGSVLRKGILVVTARLLGCPVIIHMHGGEFPAFIEMLPSWAHRLLIRVLNLAQRIVVLGDFWREFLIEQLEIPREKIVVIHNGVPASDSPALLERFNDSPILLFLGRVEEPKGVPELINALARPEVRALRWRAIIAGEGDLERYRKAADAAGLSDRIDFPGWVDHSEALAMLCQCDIFVLPSHYECFSIAVLEAMSSGAAVVTTPVGALPDAIKHEETGLLVPPRDEVALASAIVQLVSDAGMRRRLAKAAQDRFYAQFTIDKTADRMAALYRELSAEKVL